jgi:hypothetical protein
MRARLTALLLALVTAAIGAAAAPAATGTATLASGQKVYRGTGNRGLGALRLLRTAKLTWRHPHGGRLTLLTSAAGGRRVPLVTTTFKSGSVRLRAGTYRGLRVQTHGGWRITITALARR